MMFGNALLRGIWVPVLALAVASGAARVQAQSPSRSLLDEAAAVEALLSGGQTIEALAAARRFMHAVTDRTGFGVTNARLTVAPAEGFGMFDPRADNVYRIGEPVFAYVEVYGFSMSSLATGANRLLFDVSFTLDNLDGQQVTDAMIPMGEVRLDSYSQPIDGYFHLTYRVTGAEGPYTLRTLVVDRASGQSAEFSLPVVFADPDGSKRHDRVGDITSE